MSATATTTRAPSEAEIRHAVEKTLMEGPGLADVIGDAGTFHFHLWDDDELRASEKRRLADLWEPVYDRIEEQCREVIIREWTAAGVAFAGEYPDAPRPVRD